MTPRVALGDIATNEPLAQTFRAIAQGGPDAFYTGDIAEWIVEGQQRFLPNPQRPLDTYGGSMTLTDLANYEVSVRTPYEGTYRGYTIRSVPRSEEHTSELQSQSNLVCRLLLEKKKKK